MRFDRRLAAVAVLFAAGSMAVIGSPRSTAAIAITQAAAPFSAQTAAPVEAGGGPGTIADPNTKATGEAATASNIVLLVTAFGLILGVVAVTRRRTGLDR